MAYGRVERAEAQRVAQAISRANVAAHRSTVETLARELVRENIYGDGLHRFLAHVGGQAHRDKRSNVAQQLGRRSLAPWQGRGPRCALGQQLFERRDLRLQRPYAGAQQGQHLLGATRVTDLGLRPAPARAPPLLPLTPAIEFIS